MPPTLQKDEPQAHAAPRGEAGPPRRVFLVGCPRSGTTILQSRLTAHPRIISFPETHFFPYVFGRDQARMYARRRKSPAGRLRELVGDARLALRVTAPNVDKTVRKSLALMGREDAVERFPLRSRRGRALTRAYVDLLDEIAREAHAHAWLEKTPHHLFYTDVIRDCVPDAIFIHNIRRGQDNAASIWDAVKKYPDSVWDTRYHSPEDCARHWVRTIRETMRTAAAPGHIVVVHEHLLAEPEATLRRLCEHIGVEYSPEMLDAPARAAIHHEHEAWKGEVSGGLRRRESSKFETAFTPGERDRVLQILRREGLDEWPPPLDSRLTVA